MGQAISVNLRQPAAGPITIAMVVIRTGAPVYPGFTHGFPNFGHTASIKNSKNSRIMFCALCCSTLQVESSRFRDALRDPRQQIQEVCRREVAHSNPAPPPVRQFAARRSRPAARRPMPIPTHPAPLPAASHPATRSPPISPLAPPARRLSRRPPPPARAPHVPQFPIPAVTRGPDSVTSAVSRVRSISASLTPVHQVSVRLSNEVPSAGSERLY
ncbi:hypothetical protein GGX14DRAFT_392515 [Mycena pura]|uniref:Uncharacterized protein n=1 Tax=Mycena pura TaxID=153505 RepID=A0AAD6VN38_9AGAR|nr:hypothetical protein GGX14DRAFT_392515 [Mycena pura]